MAVSPTVVGAARGALEAAAIAAVGVAVVALGEVEAAELVPFVPAALLALRTIEGIIDDNIDPTKQRGVLGGTPSTPP